MEIWSKCDICGRDIPVGELCYGLKKGNCICKNCCTGFENCTFTLAPMPTLTPPNEWVSVEERLPEEKQRVIVRCERVGTSVGWILWGNWMTDIGPGAGKVTHWMPLPKAPKEG